jgi:hypothetical protein
MRQRILFPAIFAAHAREMKCAPPTSQKRLLIDNKTSRCNQQNPLIIQGILLEGASFYHIGFVGDGLNGDQG